MSLLGSHGVFDDRDDDQRESVEPLALERSGVVVVFHSVSVTGAWSEAEPQLAVYHAQPRDAAGQQLVRSDDAEACRDLLHETLAYGHACVAAGRLTAYDLSDPSIVAGLYLQTSLLLIARWPNPIALYSAAQLAEMRFAPEADVVHVLLRHACFPALWRVETRTGDGKLMSVYELGQDLWRKAQERAHEQARARKTERQRARRSAAASGAASDTSQNTSPFAWSPEPLDMLAGLHERLVDQRRALAAAAPCDDTLHPYPGSMSDLLRLMSVSPADQLASEPASELVSEPANEHTCDTLSAEEYARLETLRARLGPHHRLKH